MPCSSSCRSAAGGSKSNKSQAPLVGGDHPIPNLHPSLVAMVREAEANPRGEVLFAPDCQRLKNGSDGRGWWVRLIPPYHYRPVFTLVKGGTVPLKRTTSASEWSMRGESSKQFTLKGTDGGGCVHVLEIPSDEKLAGSARGLGIKSIGRRWIGVSRDMEPVDSLVYPSLREPAAPGWTAISNV